jgi:hypothetical protein
MSFDEKSAGDVPRPSGRGSEVTPDGKGRACPRLGINIILKFYEKLPQFNPASLVNLDGLRLC